MRVKWIFVALAMVIGSLAGSALAGPWIQPGDASVRSDIEMLAAYGAVDDITMQWPLPWAGVLNRLEDARTASNFPEHIRAAIDRLSEIGRTEASPGVIHAGLTLDATNDPFFIRGYDSLGREKVQGQATVELVWRSTVLHLAVGAQSGNRFDRQMLVLDGSYIAQRLGDAVIYAGYMPHWWGPGWISALSLSTNARPVPQIGFSRVGTTASSGWLLNWMGPWQFEFFAGVLDGDRISRNTIYDGMRFVFSPTDHLQIGISRTDQMCGKGHPCKPLAEYFDFLNGPGHTNSVNDEGSIEVRYTDTLGPIAYALYTQAMNEDNNPIVNSGTSHLFGATVWTPIEDGVVRIVAEYTDSRATNDIWGGGISHGFSYNNFQYFDGMRYRDRTLGFSLDSDSRLLSLQANFTDAKARSYTLTVHHAIVSDPANRWGNITTTGPVTINAVQARFSMPVEITDQRWRVEVEGRVQDDQLRPHHGYSAAVEVALSVDV